MKIETFTSWAERILGPAEHQARLEEALAVQSGYDNWRYVVDGNSVCIEGTKTGDVDSRDTFLFRSSIAVLPCDLHLVHIHQFNDTILTLLTDDPDSRELQGLIANHNSAKCLLRYHNLKCKRFVSDGSPYTVVEARVQTSIFDSTQSEEVCLMSDFSILVRLYEDTVQAIYDFVVAHSPDL